jgi:hypothetical protein
MVVGGFFLSVEIFSISFGNENVNIRTKLFFKNKIEKQECD